MLLRFNISNFLSFNDEQEFSMFSGKVQRFNERVLKYNNKLNVLKFCALYGANASGKSNLIKAIDTAREIIISGIDNHNFNAMYCKLKKENRKKGSKFEFEIKIGEQHFAYGFNVNLNDETILAEWLYKITPSSEEMIFERDMINKTFCDDIKFKNIENRNGFDVYVRDLKNMDKVLLISEINRKNLIEKDYEMFNNIYEWFDKQLNIIYPDTVLGNYFSKIQSQDEIIDIKHLLDYFDTGITDYEFEPSSLEEIQKQMSYDRYEQFSKTLKKVSSLAKKNTNRAGGTLRTEKQYFEFNYEKDNWNVKKLLFKHGKNSEAMFEYGEESDGTRRLIELLDVIQNNNDNKIFLIDELDRSFHPQMTRKFIETFFKTSINKETQLFITTHESNLLDLQLLRQDEIWFIERNNEYVSRLYSLDNFKVRYDKKIDKDYLEGRYGAVPIFKDFGLLKGDIDEKC